MFTSSRRSGMVIDNNLPSVNHGRFALGKQKGKKVKAEDLKTFKI